MCREAGNSRIRRGTYLPVAQHDDGRQLEVVAGGLPLFGGAELAIDTTITSVQVPALCEDHGGPAFLQRRWYVHQ